MARRKVIVESFGVYNGASSVDAGNCLAFTRRSFTDD